ncbi:TIR domain-containing protein [Candidatus Bipolaricaulota bacterium]|nr:TIR domain-containing protein [Candidatus Bipolaricaulota bacterium]HBR09952.1 hypothetical protein [Candidatus Acetothermia bacterium]
MELAIVNTAADVAASKGAVPIIAHRDRNPTGALPSSINTQIESSNYVIGIMTQNGHHIEWVNAEIAYSQKVNKPVFIIADKGLKVSPQYKVIRIDRTAPLKTLSTVSIEIQKLIKDKEIKNLIGGLVIGGLIFILLSSLKGE